MHIPPDLKDRIISEVEAINKHLFAVGHELSDNDEYLFFLLVNLKHELRNGQELSPLLLLEIFLCTHGGGYPLPVFVLDWLYLGALAFHQSEGKEHFERGLGFRSGSGRWSGQGSEFDIIRRENSIQRERLYYWIWCLNKIERIKLDEAIGIVHRVHEELTKGKHGKRKGLTESTLERGYKDWKGKKIDEQTATLHQERWNFYRTKWIELFKKLDIDFPAIKPTRNKPPSK